MKKCPKSGSENIKIGEYIGSEVLKCNDCGFDESKELDVFPEEKVSQKAKESYSPYKAGGSKRSR